MKLAALLVLFAIPSLAQFRMIEITFHGIGCQSCMESLPERLKRLRGVETAVVDTAAGTVTARLTGKNRIRLEQVRDLIEQDGTRTLKATVEVAGEVSQSGGKWVLVPAGVAAEYELESAGASIAAGTGVFEGEAALHPDSGRIVIKVRRVQSGFPRQ
jgi:copper chaperone CopZ